MKQYLIPFLVGVAFIALGIVTYQIGHGAGYAEGINQPHKPDTVWREKTVYVDKPVEVVKWKDREKPVYVPVNKDSLVYIHDTTFIALEREYKLYDGENYQCQVSGIDPALEWLKINQQTAYITNTVVDKRKWTFGITAGPGILYDGKIHAGLGIVAGVQYRF